MCGSTPQHLIGRREGQPTGLPTIVVGSHTARCRMAATMMAMLRDGQVSRCAAVCAIGTSDCAMHWIVGLHRRRRWARRQQGHGWRTVRRQNWNLSTVAPQSVRDGNPRWSVIRDWSRGHAQGSPSDYRCPTGSATFRAGGGYARDAPLPLGRRPVESSAFMWEEDRTGIAKPRGDHPDG